MRDYIRKIVKTAVVRRLSEVVKGRIYLVNNEPVRLVCTDEPGWLRGHVAVYNIRGIRANAQAETLTSERRRYTLDLIRQHNDWLFDVYPKVVEINPDWIGVKLADARAAAVAAQYQVTMYEELEKQLEAQRAADSRV